MSTPSILTIWKRNSNSLKIHFEKNKDQNGKFKISLSNLIKMNNGLVGHNRLRLETINLGPLHLPGFENRMAYRGM